MEEEQKQQQQYVLFIRRKDEDHVIVKQTTNYDECYEKWQELIEQWKSCATSPEPFVLTDPVVVAFEPGLISSIAIKPLSNTGSGQEKSPNPYRRQMQNNGFSSTMQNLTQGADLLDGGYNL